jgi:hypothetical protein
VRLHGRLADVELLRDLRVRTPPGDVTKHVELAFGQAHERGSTYASLMGALALGMALAFGLGGREVAGEMLRGAYVNQREQVR